MAASSCLAAITLLALVVASSATEGCTTILDSKSLMFGGGLNRPFNRTWAAYEQETQWRAKGDITKINLYYDDQDKCLRGVKPTYGYQSTDALRLGSEGTSTRDFFTNDLKLQPSFTAPEVFIKAEYRYNTQCVEFLRLTTNKQRQLAIGNSDSTSPLLTSQPVASKGVFLAFFKGFTDEKMKGARTGLLQQLQITWAQRTCNTSVPSSSGNPSQPPVVPSPPTPSPPIIVPPTPTPTPAPIAAKCNASTLMGCSNGKCPSSSCTLSGLGADVPVMCYGVNAQVFGDLDAVINPCTNLACKLDVGNCTSQTLLGIVGSVCTGKIVAPDPTAKLHPIGSLLQNYPCIEHTGALMNLLPNFGNAGNGLYVAKSWKACDCLAGIAAVVQTLENLPNGINFTVPDLTSPALAAALAKLFMPSLPVGDWATTFGQWLAANALQLPIPQLVISPTAAVSLKSILGGNFTLPCLILPELSATLLSLPASLKGVPVYKIPTALLTDVAKVVNLTTLATLVIPSGSTDPLSTLLSTVGLSVPDVTIGGFKDLASAFISNGSIDAALTSLLSSTGLGNVNIPLVNLTMVDLFAQLKAAAQTGQLPILSLITPKINALKALIPGFTTPSVLVANVTAALLQTVPQALGIPTFVIPDSMLNTVNVLLTNLTALPTIIQDAASAVNLPSISLADFNIANLITKVEKLALSSTVPLLGLPSLPTLGNLLKVNITGMASFVSILEQSLAASVTQGASGGFTGLLSSLGSAVSSVIPDELQSVLFPSGLASTVASVASSLTGGLNTTDWAALPAAVQSALQFVTGSGSGSGNSTTGPVDSGNSTAAPVDSGNSTTGPVDSGNSTTGPVDSGNSTAAPVDSGNSTAAPVDSGNSTAAPVDSGNSTAAPVDSGNSTAAPVDSGNSTAAPVDSGNSTAGPVDSGNSTAGSVNSENPTAAPVDSGNSTAAPVDSGNSAAAPVDSGNSTAAPVDSGNSTAGA